MCLFFPIGLFVASIAGTASLLLFALIYRVYDNNNNFIITIFVITAKIK